MIECCGSCSESYERARREKSERVFPFGREDNMRLSSTAVKAAPATSAQPKAGSGANISKLRRGAKVRAATSRAAEDSTSHCQVGHNGWCGCTEPPPQNVPV
jgi:hypothetical protein